MSSSNIGTWPHPQIISIKDTVNCHVDDNSGSLSNSFSNAEPNEKQAEEFRALVDCGLVDEGVADGGRIQAAALLNI